jgi:hypothetical protein
MQPSETLDQIEVKSQLQLSTYILDFLRNTQGFARFLGIAGYVFTVIFVALALYMISLPTPDYMRGNTSFGAIGFVYLIFAAVNFFVAHFCFLFGLNLHRALRNNDTVILENAFKNLMFLFRIIGVCTIVILVIYGFALMMALMM